LDWAEDNDGGAQAATSRWGIKELEDSRLRGEPFSHLGAADPNALAVNDANFAKTETLRFFQVVGQNVGNVFRPKRMKVERIFDGYAPHPNPKSKIQIQNSSYSPSFTLRSPSRSALMASGSAGTTIDWPQTQVTTNPPPGSRSEGSIRKSLPSLIERSADHRRSDPEIPAGLSVVLIARWERHPGQSSQRYLTGNSGKS
jgi:hypothetical protein